MLPENPQKPMGRPKKPIDWNIFESLCEIQCTQGEIASVLKINVDTLHDRSVAHYELPYSEIYKRYSEGGKSSLRRIQFNLAKKNASMAIWLGKQWLGQKDISRDEVKDIGQDILNAIRESEARNRVNETVRPCVEDKQPLLDKGCAGEKSPLPNELGTEGAI